MKKTALLYYIVTFLTVITVTGCSRTASLLPGSSGNENVNVDESVFADISGDYQVVETDEIGNWWHLYIGKSDDIPYYMSIYDNAAGNPGVAGLVTELNDTSLTIEIDRDLFEELPAGWSVTNDTTLTLEYSCDEDSITFTNNHLPVVFERQADPEL